MLVLVASGAALLAAMWSQLAQVLEAHGRGKALSKVRCPEAVTEGPVGDVSGSVLINNDILRVIHSKGQVLPVEVGWET